MTMVQMAMIGLYTRAMSVAMIAEIEGPTTGMMFKMPERMPIVMAYGWPTIMNPTNARNPWIMELIRVERR